MFITKRENLIMLIEILCQKLIASIIILAFLDHLKPKIFFVSQAWQPTQSDTPFQNLWIRPCSLSIVIRNGKILWKHGPYG